MPFVNRDQYSNVGKILWQVVNTDYEANAAQSLGGDFYLNEGVERLSFGYIRNKITLYSGKHWIESFAICNGVLWLGVENSL